jgi:hypothetical protein
MYFATLNNELHIIILCFATVDQEVIYRDDLVRTNLGDFGDCVEVEHPRTKSAAGDVPPEPTRQSYKLQSNSNLPSTGPSGQDPSTGPSGQDPSTGPSGQDPSTGPSRQDLRKKDFSEKKIRSRKAVSGKAARQFRRHQSPPRAFSTQDGTASYGRPFSLDALDQRAVKSSAPCLQITAMVS